MKFSYKLINKLLPKIGSQKDLVEVLNNYSYETENLGEDVFDVKLPANRFSDSASHIGIARELSVISDLNFKFSPAFLFKTETKADFKVKVVAKDVCLRYMALRFDGVKVTDSPHWIQDILRDCGLKPINNLVDIVNFVMLLTGEPMHVFDFDKLEGKEIVVRRAKKGEKILTLDEEEISLNEDVLVIADSKRPVAIAGIKGGWETGVDKNTKRILIEAANFEPSLIYKTYKKIGLPTDAALRFSHNLSLNLPPWALYEAAKLFKQIAGGKIKGIYDSDGYKEVKERKLIKFDIKKFNSFIGTDLNEKRAFVFLKKLGFEKANGGLWKAPHFRLDIKNEEDLFEEVARLYGYNLIKPQPPYFYLQEVEENKEVDLKEKITRVLVNLGFWEALTYSFISEKDVETSGLEKNDLWKVENYISEEFKYLRPTLLINLKKTALNNLKFTDSVKFFEIGNVFRKSDGKSKKEQFSLGIISVSKKENCFLETKGVLGKLLEEIGIKPLFEEKNGFLEIKNQKGKVLGELRYQKEENYHISVAEIYLEDILGIEKIEREFCPLPKFPLVYRDISFLIDRNFKVGEVIKAISKVDVKHIEEIDLIDEYFDEKLGKNRQSLTLRVVLNPQDHTFSGEEIDLLVKKITDALVNNFAAEIR